MHEWLKVSEVGLIECQTCEKKIYVVKKCVGKIFLKFFSLNLILIHILDSFYHFQSFLYHKNCAYLKEVIRQNFDQCVIPVFPNIELKIKSWNEVTLHSNIKI